MNGGRTDEYLQGLLKEFRNLSTETNWVEFKINNNDPQEIGEYISALSNSAALAGKSYGYLIWGIEDDNHDIVGTVFKPEIKKVGNENLENWLLHLLNPRILFRFYTFSLESKPIVILEIDRASHKPVQFQGIEYARVSSYKKKLKDFPEIERELWRIFDRTPFEELNATENVPTEDVLNLLDYPAYFDLLNLNLPDNRSGILGRLQEDSMIVQSEAGGWNVTNMGAILFSKDLNDFKNLKRKAIRVIQYKGNNRLETIREQEGSKGYAAGFKGVIDYIDNLLPANEVIVQALRKEVPMYPRKAVRELVANALIHQDFFMRGTGPMIEIFESRMEITNPGIPLVLTERFLDSPPKSRNEALASFLRRAGICEERGSGIDKVVFECELFQLPAPLFEKSEEHTKAILFSHKKFNEMEMEDKVRACYLHACLKWVNRDFMTNTSIRERFGIEQKNSALASRIIKATVEKELIRLSDPNMSRKYAKYVPFWS